MVSAAGTPRPSLAHHAASRPAPAYLRKLAFGAGALRRRPREILESYFAKKPIRTEYLIVDQGKLAGTARIPTPRATPPMAPIANFHSTELLRRRKPSC